MIIFKLKRCWTGRLYVHLGPLVLGLGPVALFERVWLFNRLAYYDLAAGIEGARRRQAQARRP